MTPADTESTLDATPTIVRLMKHQALGLFWEGLLRTDAREGFATLIETTSDKTSIPARAGNLLLTQVNNKQFVDQLAVHLIEALESVFWVELSEYLITGTTCRFNAFGAFKRFVSTLSYIPEWLGERPALLPIAPELSGDAGIDALCRFAMEDARHDPKTRARPDLPNLFPPLAGDLLGERLPRILSVLKPLALYAAGAFSSAVSLASYYAWVIAFDAVVRQGLVVVQGVGTFELVATRAESRIEFSAEQASRS